MSYEMLLREAEAQKCEVYEKSLKPNIKGLYSHNVIWLNKHIPTSTEKYCVLAEELGHHHTSVGDIIDQAILENRKQELRARSWAYEKLVPLSKIVQAHKAGLNNQFELAEYLDVTEEFLRAALKRYKEKYGLTVIVDGVTLCLEPLGVFEIFD